MILVEFILFQPFISRRNVRARAALSRNPPLRTALTATPLRALLSARAARDELAATSCRGGTAPRTGRLASAFDVRFVGAERASVCAAIAGASELARAAAARREQPVPPHRFVALSTNAELRR